MFLSKAFTFNTYTRRMTACYVLLQSETANREEGMHLYEFTNTLNVSTGLCWFLEISSYNQDTKHSLLGTYFDLLEPSPTHSL